MEDEGKKKLSPLRIVVIFIAIFILWQILSIFIAIRITGCGLFSESSCPIEFEPDDPWYLFILKGMLKFSWVAL